MNKRGFAPIIIILIAAVAIAAAAGGYFLRKKVELSSSQSKNQESQNKKPIKSSPSLTKPRSALFKIGDYADVLRIWDFVFASSTKRYAFYISGYQTVKPEDVSNPPQDLFKREEEFVVIDAKEGKRYQAIAPPGVIFSPDGQHTVYRAIEKKKEFLVIDGKEGKRYDDVPSYAQVFSADGEHFAYTAKNGDNWFIVYNGQEAKQYPAGKMISDERSVPSNLRFSPDGSHFAYTIGETGKNKFIYGIGDVGNKFNVVLDGVNQKKYDYIRDLTFSPDGNQFAYTAVEYDIEQLKNSRRFIVLNGREQNLGNTIVDSLRFTPDGKLSYISRDNVKSSVVFGEQKSKQYDFLREPIFSPDGKHFAFIAIDFKTKKGFVVADGVEGKKYDYDKVHHLNYSTSGDLIYIAEEGGKIFIVNNQQEGAKYEINYGDKVKIQGDAMIISPDGKHLAFSIEKDESAFNEETQTLTLTSNPVWIIVDGEKMDDNIFRVDFSPDGKHLIYYIKEGERTFLKIDDRELKKYDMILRSFFSKDGNSLIYFPFDGKTLYYAEEFF